MNPGAAYLASRGIERLPDSVRWIPRDAADHDLARICWPERRYRDGGGPRRQRVGGYGDDVVGVLRYSWTDRAGAEVAAEVEGVTTDGERRDYRTADGTAKRCTLPGGGIGAAGFVVRWPRPGGRLHVCEGAIDALSVDPLGLSSPIDGIIAAHGDAGLPKLASWCSYAEIWIYPHHLDVRDSGEVYADRLADALHGRGIVLRSAHHERHDLNDELCGQAPRRMTAPADDPSSLVMSLADVRPTYQPMIWRPWLPVGGLSMIAGAPGAGKTLVMTAIAAAMTRGDALPGEPDGTTYDPAMVGWLSIEEDPEMVIAPRMRVAGAVMERVLLHRIPEAECVIGSPIVARMLDYLLRQCRLVVFDSLEAWSGGAELSRPKEARRVVGWLHAQAKERRSAIAAILEGEHEQAQQGAEDVPNQADITGDSEPGLEHDADGGRARAALCVIHHDRKAASAESLAKVSGSRQVTAPAESVMLVVRTQGGGNPEGGQLWLAHAKCRVARREDAWKLAIEARQIALHDPETGGTVMGEHGAVVWHGQEPGVSAETLASMMAGGDPGSGSEDDREDADALALACVRAYEAGTMPEGIRDEQVNRAWLMMVASSTERPSGRPRSKRWHADVLKAVGVRGRLSNGDRWWSIDQIRGQCR